MSGGQVLGPAALPPPRLGPLQLPLPMGVTADELVVRIGATYGPCRHDRTVAVDLVVTGEVVAALCEDCLTRLPASWGCEECEYIEDRRICSATPSRVMGRPCERHERMTW